MSVAIGAILGFIFLKEPFTPRKALSILSIVAGMVLLKLV
jgi:multidrug transporter EmrE-like cation transporter